MTDQYGERGDDEVIKTVIYVPRSMWEQLRSLGIPERASASAQVVELIADYLASPPRRQRDVLRRATERSKGRRGDRS